ncbi:MAG: hypothetical protein A2Y17_08135 [Clostridiales bacterium GWF2_38_85]|nr:MAG: hypothetical protein A2Y17_08135 [Clostridiales bacterium GWF2_38_85]HBL83839.1 hypothetical protein [Clostridiales bacterium]
MLVYRSILTTEYDSAVALCKHVFDTEVAPHNIDQGKETFAKFVLSDDLKIEYINGAQRFFGCFDDNMMVGIISVKGKPSHSHISLLFILPEYEKQGIGRQLINATLKDAKKITVNASINAVGFYSKQGFHSQSDVVTEDGLSFVPMIKNYINRNIKLFSSVMSVVLPISIVSFALLFMRISPFGDKSILIYDLKSQYIDFYNSLRHIFTDNEWFYSFSRTLGGDNFTLIAYYLLSPFNLILLFFNEKTMADGVLLIYLLKTAAVALTFSICMQKSRIVKYRTFMFYGILPAITTAYTLCGFAASYSMNVFWLDAMILLPLISFAVEKAAIKKKNAYVLLIALACIINFYFGFLLTLFALTAFMSYSKILSLSYKVISFATFLRMTAIGVMLSGIVTVPVFFGLLGTKLSSTNPLGTAFEWIGYTDSVRMFKFLFVFAAAIILALTIIKEIIGKGESEKERQLKPQSELQKLLTFLAIAVISLTIIAFGFDSLLDSAASFVPLVFNNEKPTLFVTITVLVLALYLIVNRNMQRNKRLWLVAFAAVWFLPNIVGILYLFLHMGQQPLSYPGRYSFIFSFILVQNALVCVVYLFRRKTVREYLKITTAASITLLIILSTAVNTVATFKYNESVYYSFSVKQDYVNFIEQNKAAVSELETAESGFYRVEKTYNRSLNDAYTLGTNGISHYSSMYENELINTLNLLGFSASAYWAQYSGSTPVTDMLFGINYVLSSDEYNDSGRRFYQQSLYAKLKTVSGIDIYKNNNALPLAYMVGDSFGAVAVETSDPLVLQNLYVNTMLGYECNVFDSETDFSLEAVDMEYSAESARYIGTGALKYELDIQHDGGLYMFLESYSPVPIKIYVNGIFVSDYFTQDICGTAYLGEFGKGENVIVELSAINGAIDYTFESFQTLNYVNLQKAYDALYKTTNNITASGNKITANANASGTLFLSLPYSAGWEAVVDGKKADIFNGGNGFLCVRLEGEGTHSISLTYIPIGMGYGIAISCMGLLCLIISIIGHKTENKKNK